MAELKASEVKYSTPLKVAVSDLYLTATRIEFPASAEYPEGGVELNKEKLGLPDSTVSGTAVVAREAAVGETATTTALPTFALCSAVTLAKTENEEKVQVTTCFPATVSSVKGKLFLRIFSQETAGIGKVMIEPKTSTKAAVGLCSATVFVLGK